MDQVSIRMYCMGTGDCFLLKFTGQRKKFLMMIDCGSCVGQPNDFKPYVEDLAAYIKKEGGLDLLIVTHEHQDHVNGFHKCKEIFEDPSLEIREAWFAWTEHPDDPDGRAAELQEKRKKMRKGFAKALNAMVDKKNEIINNFDGDYAKSKVGKSHEAFLNGLRTLAEVNLEEGFGVTGESLAGMKTIKEILKKKKTRIKYRKPGEIKTLEAAKGLTFYVLGPPYDREAIFKDGKEGKDVYKKYLAIDRSVVSADFFNAAPDGPDQMIDEKRFAFESRYMVDREKIAHITGATDTSEMFGRGEDGNLTRLGYDQRVISIVEQYKAAKNSWRNIDHDWLGSAGTLALRLNSHINNTSLAIAIESEKSGKVILLPGDAEFGSWESWHLIPKWSKKGKNDKHLTEDLLNRTVFYKVAHHLSYNGTALEKGIKLMPESGMVSMVTLDRTRISSKWKTTMPNKELLGELIKRCEGKVFIMDEKEIKNAPSGFLDASSLKKGEYREHRNSQGKLLYKEYKQKI